MSKSTVNDDGVEEANTTNKIEKDDTNIQAETDSMENRESPLMEDKAISVADFLGTGEDETPGMESKQCSVCNIQDTGCDIMHLGSSSTHVQTVTENLVENAEEELNVKIPLSVITLQSILIAARAKSTSKMSSKQFAIYQLSNEIITMIQPSLQSERDSHGLLTHPITSTDGEEMDRLAWWFTIIHRCVQDLNPPRGYILPALKLLRQDISAIADVALEMIWVHKMLHKQLHQIADVLNNVFARHEDLFGVRNWERALLETRREDRNLVEENFDKLLKSSGDCAVKLTAFEMKALLVEHDSNTDFKPVSLNKLGLKTQRELIKSCIEHVNSLLRKSCDHCVQAHSELHRAEKDIQECVQKLVKKLEYMRRIHRFRDSNCAYLLKKSLSALGLCFYEYIDMIRSVRKICRFVLLASEHVLRHANGWSHLCDVACLQQLNEILEEFVEKEKLAVFNCFRKNGGRETRRDKVMVAFEEYFQQWVESNANTVQVTLPVTHATASMIFKEEVAVDTGEKVSVAVSAETIENPVLEPATPGPDLEVTFITKHEHKQKNKTSEDIETANKLEEIGIKLECHSGLPDKPGVSAQKPIIM